MNKGWVAAVFAVALGAGIAAGACKANITLGCEGGQCTSSGVTSGGGGAAACVPTPDPGTDTNGFPPLVYEVFKKNCFRCHGDPLMNGAPHTFLHYHDTQCIYYASPACIACKGDHACLEQNTCKTWWSQQILHALTDPSKANTPGHDDSGRQLPGMPFGLGPIPDCEQQILRDWFATCGSDPTVTNMCMKGTGTDTGMPCAEEAMGTTTSSSSSSSSGSSSSSASSTSASSSSSTGTGG